MGYRLKFIILALCSLFLIPLSAQEITKQEKKEAAKSHLKQHFKPYGFTPSLEPIPATPKPYDTFSEDMLPV